MTREEIIEGLRAGRTLVQDGWATEQEVRVVDDLVREGLATRDFREGDQYSAYLIRGTDRLRLEVAG